MSVVVTVTDDEGRICERDAERDVDSVIVPEAVIILVALAVTFSDAVEVLEFVEYIEALTPVIEFDAVLLCSPVDVSVMVADAEEVAPSCEREMDVVTEEVIEVLMVSITDKDTNDGDTDALSVALLLGPGPEKD